MLLHRMKHPTLMSTHVMEAHPNRATLHVNPDMLLKRTVVPNQTSQTCCAGTLRPIPTEPLCIPDLCLAGRLPQQHNAVFNLDLSAANAVLGAAADVTAWPEFHNGVAAGKLCQKACQSTAMV